MTPKQLHCFIVLCLLVCLPLASAAYYQSPVNLNNLPMGSKLINGGITLGRAVDVYTSQHYVRDTPFQLPNTMVCNSGLMALYTSGVGIGQVAVTNLLLRHGHSKISRTLEFAHLGLVWGVAVNNFRIMAQGKPPYVACQ